VMTKSSESAFLRQKLKILWLILGEYFWDKVGFEASSVIGCRCQSSLPTDVSLHMCIVWKVSDGCLLILTGHVLDLLSFSYGLRCIWCLLGQ
jgi:hypothetical protein